MSPDSSNNLYHIDYAETGLCILKLTFFIKIHQLFPSFIDLIDQSLILSLYLSTLLSQNISKSPQVGF